MMITKQGEVTVFTIHEIMPTKEDFLFWEVTCMAFDFEAKISGNKEIFLKIWPEKGEKGKPTIIDTGLKWKTFNMDDNLIVIINYYKSSMHFHILITKEHSENRKLIWQSEMVREARKRIK